MKVLDLFCGAGGLSHGFKELGFDVTGMDISDIAGDTFVLNKIGKFIKADLSIDNINGNYDIITGGPPCKPWASVNIRRRTHAHKDYHLLEKFFQIIGRKSPEMFLLENVPPIANDLILREYLSNLENHHNYSIKGQLLRYSDYGAPTSRHRYIVFGIKSQNAEMFFDKLNKFKSSPKTVKDAIWDLKNLQMGQTQDHVWSQPKTIHKYRKYYETGKYGWFILDWRKPAPSFGNILKTYVLHPDSSIDGNGRPPRVISVKEALLIMGFENNFHLPEHAILGMKYQMAVDSVSPVFSYAAARVIKEILQQ